MFNNWLVFLSVLTGLANYSSAQQDSLVPLIPDIIIEADTAPEWLSEPFEIPFDLNLASPAKLKRFEFLTDKQIDSLTSQRPFYKKSQVKDILGYNIYRKFRTYFFLGKPRPGVRWDFLNRIIYPVQKNTGVIQGVYSGFPFDFYSRFKFHFGSQLSGGFLIQKDIGEQHLFDHFSGYIQWSGFSERLKLIIGNFIVHAGEGLILSSPFSAQKSADAMSVLKSRDSYSRSYLSASEATGFTGIYTRYSFQKYFSLAIFYSQALRDATVSSKNFITGMALSGLHRTPGEQLGRDILSDKTKGVITRSFITDQIQLGFAFIRSSFEPSINTTSHNEGFDIRNSFFRFSGSGNDNYSLYYKATFSRLNIYGELAATNLNRRAIHLGSAFLLKNWRFGLRWWHLTTGFQSPYGRSFSSQSAFPSGVQGFYLGLSGKLSDPISINFYWNTENKLWRTYFSPLPVKKQNMLIQLTITPFPTMQTNFRFQSLQNQTYNSSFRFFVLEKKKRIRIQIDKQINKNLKVRIRYDRTFISDRTLNPAREGMSFFQELQIRFPAVFQIIGRFTSFKTDDFDARIYEVEHGLSGASALSAFYASGFRWYIIFHVNILRGLKLSLKFRRLHLDGVQSIGSGLDKIKSDTREEIRVQIRFSG